MDIRLPVLAILVGGATAPGVNGVISSVTIEALNSECTVLGILEGFKHLKEGKSVVTNLDYEDVNRIHTIGGSILRASKEQLSTAGDIDNCLRVLEHHRVRHLITIGGTQTAYSASLLADAAKAMRVPLGVIHVPKSVFNDLPLPADSSAFGFATARELGTQLMTNFALDARTMLRWYVVMCIGQMAGHLALGIGKSSAATLTLIPEQFAAEGVPLAFDRLCSIVEAAIYKRRAMTKEFGVVVISEGVVRCMDEAEVKARWGSKDVAHQQLSASIADELHRRFAERRLSIRIVPRSIGNELRSAAPNATDIELSRDLGFAATRYILEGGQPAIVTLRDQCLFPIPLAGDQLDQTNRTMTRRYVDTTTLSYQAARSYMIYLKERDLADMDFLYRIAKAANMSTIDFVRAFEDVAERSAQKTQINVISPSPPPNAKNAASEATSDTTELSSSSSSSSSSSH